MVSRILLAACLLASNVLAQGTDSELSFTNTFSTVSDFTPTLPANASYVSPTGQSTVTSSPILTTTSSGFNSFNSSTLAPNATITSGLSQSTVSSTSSDPVTLIGGTSTPSAASNATAHTTTSNNASATSTSAIPTNTVPCNGFPELCERKYSNISNVCAHNAAFSVKNNAFSNQQLDITDQLNDGVRMLQGETYYVNDTVYNCHSACELLNVGPWQQELETVREWLEDNPYNVVTILIVNSQSISVEKYVDPIKNSGLLEYAYEPAYVPQYRDQWPTLSEMILNNKRVVFFMDYNANQTAVPYILDEFTHIWETPSNPTNQSFPCTLQRPPGLNETEAREKYMYMANHNLNVAVNVGEIIAAGLNLDVYVPATGVLNTTNGQADQFGQLGATATNCTADWGIPPTFMMVDYYNIGSPEEGSALHVAARLNGVNYTKSCCGLTSAAPALRQSYSALVLALVFAILSCC